MTSYLAKRDSLPGQDHHKRTAPPCRERPGAVRRCTPPVRWCGAEVRRTGAGCPFAPVGRPTAPGIAPDRTSGRTGAVSGCLRCAPDPRILCEAEALAGRLDRAVPGATRPGRGRGRPPPWSTGTGEPQGSDPLPDPRSPLPISQQCPFWPLVRRVCPRARTASGETHRTSASPHFRTAPPHRQRTGCGAEMRSARATVRWERSAAHRTARRPHRASHLTAPAGVPVRSADTSGAPRPGSGADLGRGTGGGPFPAQVKVGDDGPLEFRTGWSATLAQARRPLPNSARVSVLGPRPYGLSPSCPCVPGSGRLSAPPSTCSPVWVSPPTWAG